jgi:hypothetical protein
VIITIRTSARCNCQGKTCWPAEIVAGFNGFYGRHGDYILENQNRVLIAVAAGMVALLVAAGFAVRALVRSRRRRRAQA